MKDDVIYTRHGNKPVSFADKRSGGRRKTNIDVNGKKYSVYMHDAIWMFYHDRPIGEDKLIHHKDGNPGNNIIENLIELTPKQHKRVHEYQCDDPMRGIYLYCGAWQFCWIDDSGRQRARRFHGINEAMTFRAEIEEPRRQELRALSLQCKRSGSGPTNGIIRRISRPQRTRQWRHRQ